MAPWIAQPTPAPQPSERTTFVHLFEWTWNDVAQECEQYLGPQGFRAVQVSPPQEHVIVPELGYPWWQRYQPVSYQLESRSGNREEFAAMVAQCRQAGVEVYADAVINHMAGIPGGTGSGGTPFTKYDYPGLYDADDFNRCRQPVKDYADAADVTQCELVGLADLDTRSEFVQTQIVEYLTDLTQLGVAGFRIDAAKHIRSTELAEILARFRSGIESDPFIYQEVIDPGTEAIKKQSYYASGDVIDFEYGRLVGEAFLGLNGRSLANLVTLGEREGLAPSDKAVVFIDNHDKQRGHGGGGNYLTHKTPDLYRLANIFMLAYPYGTPQVMSSYTFSSPDQGPPANDQGSTQRVYQNGEADCGDAWICEHRWAAIGNMVGFRNWVGTAELNQWWTNGSTQIAFGRGDRGFVVINQEAAPLTQTFQTQLPAGDYCNVVEVVPTDFSQGCGDATLIQVDAAGRFTATVQGVNAIAIHGGARLNP